MQNSKNKRLTTLAIMMALVVVLQLISATLSFFQLFSIALVLIPVVISAVKYGIKGGALMGGVFGVIAFICCFTGLDKGGFMVFDANPYLCFVVVLGKGILSGMAAAGVYRLLCKKNERVALICASAVCPIVNTGIFLTCMFTFYMDVLKEWANGGEVIAYVLSGIVLINFVPEFLANVVFGAAGHRIIKKIK